MIKSMRFKVFIFFAFIFSLIFGTFTACAQDYNGFSIKVPENFKCVSDIDNVVELSETVGMSEKELREYYKSGNLSFLAVDDNNSTQIKISETVNDFSKQAQSFKKFNDDELISISGSLFDTSSVDGTNVSVVENNGSKFLKFFEAHKDSGGIYTVTNYLTVENGKIYRLSFFAPENSNSLMLGNVFKSFSIKVDSNYHFSLSDALILLAILVFLLVIVLSVVNIVKIKKEESEETPSGD